MNWTESFNSAQTFHRHRATLFSGCSALSLFCLVVFLTSTSGLTVWAHSEHPTKDICTPTSPLLHNLHTTGPADLCSGVSPIRLDVTSFIYHIFFLPHCCCGHSGISISFSSSSSSFPPFENICCHFLNLP